MGFAPSFTPRYVGKYRAGGRQHEILIRGLIGESRATTVNRATTTLRLVMEAIKGKLPDDFLWVSAKYIPEDSEVSSPEDVPVQTTGALALNTFSKKDRIAAVKFSGRSVKSPGGFFVYSLQFSEDVVPDANESDYIITRDEDTDIDAAITALIGSGVPAVDGTVIRWYNQVTYKTNDLYVKKLRKGQ